MAEIFPEMFFAFEERYTKPVFFASFAALREANLQLAFDGIFRMQKNQCQRLA
ncbi:hypothetical protein [Symmachiella dynata]|uniref:hypothetical protein n=1 Tax=Symmachiella dynata TaxID=2527995 RepID=UPI0018D48D10|nr:hypothetical protein [Symmachiella dynata]